MVMTHTLTHAHVCTHFVMRGIMVMVVKEMLSFFSSSSSIFPPLPLSAYLFHPLFPPFLFLFFPSPFFLLSSLVLWGLTQSLAPLQGECYY